MLGGALEGLGAGAGAGAVGAGGGIGRGSNHGGGGGGLFQDQENVEAKEALMKISGRLDGKYNLKHPYYREIHAAYLKRGVDLPIRGVGATADDDLSLSVQGQVHSIPPQSTLLISTPLYSTPPSTNYVLAHRHTHY